MMVMASAASRPQCRAANRQMSLMATVVEMRGERKAYPSAVTVIGYFIFCFQSVVGGRGCHTRTCLHCKGDKPLARLITGQDDRIYVCLDMSELRRGQIRRHVKSERSVVIAAFYVVCKSHVVV